MRVAGACISGGIVAPILLMRALARAPAASVSLWLPLESVWTALLAWLFFREHIDRFTSAALALIVAAGVLLAGPGRLSGGTAAVLAAVACLCWGIDNNLTATIDRLRPAQLTFVKGAVGAAVNLGVSLARGASLPSPPHVLQAIAIGMLGYGASLALYITGSQRLGAARAQLLFATAPLAGVAVAWLGLGEQPLPLQGAASVLTAVAWLLLLRSQHGHLHAHEALEHVHGHRHDDAHHDHEHSGLAPGVWHTHEHRHEAVTHSHAHLPDLHHRHEH
jgi:drug/metabolite transporter (DMT)-like permease